MTKMKITKKKIEKMANELINYARENGLDDCVSFFFNNRAVHLVARREEKRKNVDPHDYFEWAAYDHILSMSFDSTMYEVFNYNLGHGVYLNAITKIFEKYGVYYELGNAWNLTTFVIDDETEVEYTKYQKKKKDPVCLVRKEPIDSEFLAIMDRWYELAKETGDKGACVLGAGFNFEKDGIEYKMPAQSPWQGSLSWEGHIDTIRSMLELIGCKNIHYNWGNMD